MDRSSDEAPPGGERTTPRQGGRRDWALWLLLIPFVALLYPAFYARVRPELDGVPFFIWYQFAWVIAGSAVTAAVYVLRDRPRRRP